MVKKQKQKTLHNVSLHKDIKVYAHAYLTSTTIK